MKEKQYFTLGFLVGAALISIPLMWNIEDLEAKVKTLEEQIEETPLFEYQPTTLTGRRETE